MNKVIYKKQYSFYVNKYEILKVSAILRAEKYQSINSFPSPRVVEDDANFSPR